VDVVKVCFNDLLDDLIGFYKVLLIKVLFGLNKAKIEAPCPKVP